MDPPPAVEAAAAAATRAATPDPISLAGSASWTSRAARPPNHPLSSKPVPNYSTFTAGDPPLGLSTRTARRRLVHAIERKLEEKARSTRFTTEFRDPFALLLLVCAAFRLVDFARQAPVTIAPLLEGVFLLGAAAVNVLLNAVQRRRHHDEVAERVRAAVAHVTAHDDDRDKDTSATPLMPSTNLIACYRDSQWRRLPTNLLVEGDVVALMSGEAAPGDVYGLQPPHGVFARGTTMPAATHATVDATRCDATFNPSLLLSLCGDMRVYELRETPVVRDIDDALFKIARPATSTQKLQAAARLVAIYVCTLYSVLVLAAIGLRVALQHRSLHATLNQILLGPIGVWLCFASLHTPLVLFVAEAVATASVLGSFERAVEANASPPPATRRPTSSPRHASTNADDQVLDAEEREQLRSGRPQSAFRKSLDYFLTALRFRVAASASAHAGRLPVPFRAFRLLERLGSATMLCCFDDDVLCEPAPCVEEIFLLRDKPPPAATVLDLHADRDGDTGVKFEDPKWRAHLASLKPLALAILLNDTEQPAEDHHAALAYLMAPPPLPSEPGSPTSCQIEDPYLRACVQRLSAHVRMVPPPTHLLPLAREIGFARDPDLAHLRRLQTLHTICPRLAHHEHTLDHHDQGQDDARLRGNLKSHRHASVVLDSRSHRLQLLARGHPAQTLAHCTEYWDGKSICPLTHDKRRAVLDMFAQWRGEDLDCVALAYAPVPAALASLLFPNRHALSPPVYLVEDSTAAGDDDRVAAPPPLSPPSPVPQVAPPRRSSSAGTATTTAATPGDRQAKLWQLHDDQIFLGMVASGVQPHRAVPDVIEDLTAAGVRFVYFSPRNMRRSKLLAEKMGIETDWNCAISLRPLDHDNTPDPHRMTSHYSDWDVKARLPHGVDAIQRHLRDVDNVPLLVSLYTDSTPATVAQMLAIFQHHHEVVLGVGAAFKAANAPLFAAADLAVALHTPLHTQWESTTKHSEPDHDLDLSRVLNTLPCALGVAQLAHALDLLRLGRCLLTNLHQLLAFIFVSQLFLATLLLATYALPFPAVPQLSCASIFWFLWGLVPLLSLTMLASPPTADVMKRTPRKNEPVEYAPRLAAYVALRHLPAVLVSVLVFEAVLGLSLASDRDALGPAFRHLTWIDFVRHPTLALERPRPPPLVHALDRAEAAMILVVGLSIIVSSTSYLYRFESVAVESPLRNRIWLATAAALAIVQLAMSALRAGLDGLPHFLSHVLPWYLYAMVAAWLLAILAIDEAVKAHDRHHMTRYYKFLRMQFDTRLGMWSPK